MSGLKRVGTRQDDALSRVAWHGLETLLAAHYTEQGFAVEHVGTGGTGRRFDGGIDLRLRRGDEHILVQVKHWNAYKVPHNDVHQLLGLMVNERATGAVLVTSGEFTKAAVEAATRHGHVQLIDGDELRSMLGPLPEPPTAAGSKAHVIAAHVGERLLNAAEDRIRDGTGRRGGFVTRSLISTMLLKAALAAAFMIFIFAVFQMTLHRVLRTVSRPQPARVTEPMSPVVSPAPVGAPAGASNGRVDPNPCHEIVDLQTGTYIDHCAQTRPRKRRTAAEIREQQRKADEAMKVIEATTPEI